MWMCCGGWFTLHAPLPVPPVVQGDGLCCAGPWQGGSGLHPRGWWGARDIHCAQIWGLWRRGTGHVQYWSGTYLLVRWRSSTHPLTVCPKTPIHMLCRQAYCRHSNSMSSSKSVWNNASHSRDLFSTNYMYIPGIVAQHIYLAETINRDDRCLLVLCVRTTL